MPRLKIISFLRSCLWFIWKRLQELRRGRDPNLRGVVRFPPGHFYSPLLDIQGLGPNDSSLPFDGVECWEHVNLQPSEQRFYYEDLLERFPFLPFPSQKSHNYRYFTENNWFVVSDAFTLSGIIRKEKPRRIVEIGSGFSSAVMLDTLDQTQASAMLTVIEPYPDDSIRYSHPATGPLRLFLSNVCKRFLCRCSIKSKRRI